MKHFRAERHSAQQSLWWQRADLTFDGPDLCIEGRKVIDLAGWSDDPVFVYSARRAEANIQRLHRAMKRQGLNGSVLFAIKANRFSPFLTALAAGGHCGADVCSPGEVKAALSAGFPADRISYTGTALSDSDVAFLARHPEVKVNLDSLSALRRLGTRCPGRVVGLRLNPEVGVGGSAKLTYAGSKPTKFGIYPEQIDDALAIVAEHELVVDTLHIHTGCGFLSDQLPRWEAGIRKALSLRSFFPHLAYFNVGGGLGVQHSVSWGQLDLTRWADRLAECFDGTGLRVIVEPGDYIAKDAGLLVLEVNGVEEKGGTRFVSVNGGFNLAPEPAFYELPCEPVPCSIARGGAPELVTIAGNINEALDLWFEDILLPPLAEGDKIALLNAGAYASSMSSNHCLRGRFEEVLTPF